MRFSRYIREALIFGASLLGISYLYRRSVRRKGPLVRVLVFHDIEDAAWFRSIIGYLARAHHVVSPKDFLTRTFDADRVNVLVTFDDGYASWVETCLPILREHGVRALFFINSGLIDAGENREAQRQYVREKLLRTPREIISWDGVRALRDAGHTVGGHTVNHGRLSILPEHAQADEVRRDKATIERELGRPMVAFAYPFGNAADYTETTVQVVRDAPYGHAFTTAGTFADMEKPLELARTCVEDNSQSVASLDRWILGGYDVYRFIKKLCAR